MGAEAWGVCGVGGLLHPLFANSNLSTSTRPLLQPEPPGAVSMTPCGKRALCLGFSQRCQDERWFWIIR